MVSRYGVSKEGAVDVAVGVGPMHCLIGGPHHHHHLSAPHPQNPQPGHNHHVHHAAHPPPPSPGPHLNHQLSHHQLTVNINHLGHQLAQHQQAPPQYRVVTANTRSEFHVPAQNYGAQPGAQVGGGGGSVGVPGGRGPPPLGGIPTIGQSTAGIPPGGPAGGQAPPQAQAPGVQTQQSQGPAPTTTPPVHTPSPQEMGKQPHLQAHSYYPAAPRPQQPRSLNHRSGQGGSGNQVVGMPGVGGGGGQPVMYTTNLAGQPGTVYVPSHVAGLSTGPHQQPVYHMNNQIIQFSSAPQRHQAQNQSFYPPYQPHALLAQNLYPYQPGPTPQPGFFFTSPTTPLNLNRSSATAVSGGAQHVGGALGGAQGATMVPQGTLQQPTQQPQPLPQIDVYAGYNGGGTTGTSSSIRSKKPRGEKAITDIVNPSTGKNISHEIYDDDATVESGESSNRETPQPQNSSGAEVVADFAARVAKAATESSDSSSPVAAVVTAAETFASQITTQSLSNMQQTNSSNETNNQCNVNGPPTPTLQNISNVHALCSQSSLDTTSTSSNVTQIETVSTSSSSCPLPSSATPSSISSSNSTLSSAATAAAAAAATAVAAAAAAAVTVTAPSASSASSSSSSSSSSCAVKTTVESKPLQILAKEFQPRGEKKTVSSSSNEETVAATTAAAVVNIDVIPPTTQPATTPTPVVEQQEPKSTTTPSSVNLQTPATLQQPQQQTQHQQQHQHQSNQQQQQPHSVPSMTTVQEVAKPSSTAPSANPVPTRESFSNLSSKTTSSNSPPRRKSQSHNHGQSNNAIEQQLPPPPPPSAKEQKEKKREKSLSSRGATTAPAAHNQPDHHHHHHQKTNGDASVDKTEQEAVVVARNDVQQHKQNDGKAMQKQKSKNKLKPRDLNRKGAEKEGTDMDAFVNTVPPAKTEVKQQQDNKESMQLKDNNKEPIREITKETKEKDNYESKKEKEVTTVHPKVEKHVIPDIVKENAPVQTPIIEKLSNEKEITKEVSSKVEDNLKSQNTCNTQLKSVPNDVVDHASVKEDIDLEAIVAQKNEENTKISAFQAAPTEEKIPTVSIAEKSNEQNEPKPLPDTPASKSSVQLKYKYKDDQWSPLNKNGKKVYDREFLMRLQDDPNSRIKPSNLPDLEIVLKDITKTRSSTLDLRAFKDTSISKPDSLFPGFVKPALTRVLPTNRKSHPCPKPVKSAKPHVIHVSLSLREDVKLRETENAWKPTRLKPTSMSEEESKTETLYKKVRSVLNKLTPQKFNTLIEQVRALQIDSQERLQGVINLVFEKAVDEPNFSVAYALMCKELASMEAGGHDKTGEKATEGSVNFRKLILCRCQQEFEKNPIDEVARASKLKEIEECTDPEKKKDLQLALEEEDRRIRIKSVGNIRFIGELYKQGMLTRNIMHRCINHLLDQNDEDSLECLCKLLTTIGKDLEAKGKPEEMQEYFNKMQEIVGRRGQGKISSRIRFMLQDVIDLRANKWIPRRDDSNPKTIDQIQKEVESERLDTQLNNTPLNTPRKDDRNSDRKRNRGFGPADEGGWSQPVSRTRQTYSVETAKLRNKPPPMDDLQLGSRNMYMWKNPTSSSSSKTINSNKFACLENISTLEQDKRMQPVQLSGSRSTGPRDYGRDYKSSYDGRGSRNGSHQLSSASSSRESSLLDNSQTQNVSLPTQPMKSVSQTATSIHKPPLSEEAFTKALNSILKDYLSEHVLENAISDVKETFDNATFTKFVRESINFVLEKSPAERERISRLMSQLISRNILSVQHLKAGFSEVLEIVDDLIIDIPKIWTYLAEILTHPIKNEAMPLSEMRDIFISLRSLGYAGKLLGELLSKLSREKGSKWITEKWDQSKLALNDIINPDRENVDKMVKEYHLEFLVGDYNSAKSSNTEELSLQQIHEQLRKLMKEEYTFDEISSWITENVGNRVKDPKFIRILMTAILETSIVPFNETWKLNENTLGNLELLIHRFVDTDEVLELQCLYAIQAYMTKIEFPYGILRNIINKLSVDNIISSDAFLAWQKSDDPAEHEGHSVAIMTLTAFFISLQEAEDSSSVEDGPSNVNSDRC